MNSFPSEIAFKFPWRNYQKVVLDEMYTFLKDQHLHIIAPPGSGKTVLGLEVMIRLNKPTLILSPTLTIRDQWISRFCELFLRTDSVPNWVSTDIRHPSFLTVITYQGLYAACSDESSTNLIIRQLVRQRITTFVLDEAHHLKNQWWVVLNKVTQKVAPTIIGLTATPPYDSSYTEWQRYLGMNGEIDMEITIPELIREGDLCPHQDCVYFSQPTPEEFQNIHRFRENIGAVYQEFSKSELLINSFMQTEVWLHPDNHLEWIYENLAIYTSYLILLSHNQIDIPKIHFNILGIDKKVRSKEQPKFTEKRLEEILNFFLFHDQKLFLAFEKEKESIINKLKHRGAIEQRLVNLSFNSNLNRLLISSVGKLNSIVQIVRFEHTSLGEKLRMVILTDYIREEYLAVSKELVEGVKKIGIVPIFEELLASNLSTDKIGVLSGSLVILPKSATTRFHSLCQERGIAYTEDLGQEYRNNYFLVTNKTGVLKESLVELVTQLFTEGNIEVLIGTKSLLGEGWDAPVINSLILATGVGSFVLSNQMRGRAIRMQRDNPRKTSNIWHLVCIDPTTSKGGQDLETLSRRFESFVGISTCKTPYIANGLDRLNIQREIYTTETLSELNQRTFAQAQNRDELHENWMAAIESGKTLITEIKLPFPEREKPYQELKRMYLHHTIAYLLADILTAWTLFGQEVLCELLNFDKSIRDLKTLMIILSIFAGIGLVFFGKKTYTALRLFILYRDISKDIKNIGTTLLQALIKQGAIQTPDDKLTVVTEVYDDGAVSCFVEGATQAEQTIFTNALYEIVSPIDNPRYIIMRGGRDIQRADYHSVPSLLGANKNLALYFYEKWRQLVGHSELIYTRTLQGRKILLKARTHALSSQLLENQLPKKYRKWN